MFQDGRRPLPLWQLTYGDTGFFMMLYDGMGQLNAPAGFAVTPLYGAVQQYPQNLWKTMEPFWLHQVERQLLCGNFAAAEMLSYHEYLKWRVSCWKQGIVIVNDGEQRSGEFSSPIGKIQVKEMRGKANGAVCIVTKSGISSDGAKLICESGAENDVFASDEALRSHFEVLKASHYGIAYVTVLAYRAKAEEEVGNV